MNNKTLFSKNLKYLMKTHGMKNVTLAKELGLSKSAISNYISGGIPKREVLEKISNYFKVTQDDLIKSDIELKVTLKEDKIERNEIPVLLNNTQFEDVVFRNENYLGAINSPIPFCEGEECYAVIANDDSMATAGILKGHTVFFSTKENVTDDQIAAVFIRKKRKILIRRVTRKKTKITLLSDFDSLSFDETDIEILGKVVKATFTPL